MKQTIFMLLVIAAPVFVTAQSSPLEKIFDMYSGKEGYTIVTINHSMFDMFSAVAADKQDKDFKDITSKLNSIRILSVDTKPNMNAGNDFYREMVRLLTVPGYEELMAINDGGEQVKFVVRKNADRIYELVMIVGGHDPCLIAMDGDIDLKQVSKLSKSMNIKGLDHLKDADKNNKPAGH
jgi:hypothetical protein